MQYRNETNNGDESNMIYYLKKTPATLGVALRDMCNSHAVFIKSSVVPMTFIM